MAVTETLAGSIDTFCDSPLGCRACFFITIIAWFLYTCLSYGTDHWVELSEGQTESSQGLWNHCSRSLIVTDMTCRESVSNFLEYRNRDLPAWLHATRFFQSVGLIMSLISVVSSIFCTFVRKTVNKRDTRVAAAVMNFAAAGSMLIGVSIYGGQYRYVVWLKGYYLSWSFAFSIIAGIFHLVSGVIYMFAPSELGTASVQPASNQPQPPGAHVNNHNACRPEPTAPLPDPAYYIPPPGGEYHPQYPPSSNAIPQYYPNRNANPQYPTNSNPQYPASNNQQHPVNSGQNPSSTQNAQNDNDTCIVCWDHRSEILLRPCNHFNLCERCSSSVTQCPTCRGVIREKIKPYR